MELGLSTYSFPWTTELAIDKQVFFEELIDYTFQKNIRCFQFGDNYPLHLLQPERFTQLIKAGTEKNIALQAGTRRLEYDHIKKYIDIAKEIKSPFLRVVIDDADFHPAEKEVIEAIKKLLPYLQHNNIVLAIENHDRFSARSLERIIKSTSTEYVGICLDTCNSIGAGEGIHELLPILLPYTVNLHVKDFNIERVKHKMGFTVTGTAAGDGMLNIPELLNECSKYPSCKTATLELWMEPENENKSTIDKEKQWVEKSINYLKNYIQ